MLPWHPEAVGGYDPCEGVLVGCRERVCQNAPFVAFHSDLGAGRLRYIPIDICTDVGKDF